MHRAHLWLEHRKFGKVLLPQLLQKLFRYCQKGSMTMAGEWERWC
jgi:hypothetical protein